MSDKEDYETRGEKKVSRSRSPEVKRRSRSRSRSGSSRRSDSRSRSRSASRGRSRDRKYRSRSRSKGRYRSRSGSRRRRSNSRSKSPMSNRRRHVGDREDPSENCCLGVFGLSLYTTEREIKEVFGRYGPLDNINVVHDHQTGRSRGFAFVTYESVEDAKELLSLSGYGKLSVFADLFVKITLVTMDEGPRAQNTEGGHLHPTEADDTQDLGHDRHGTIVMKIPVLRDNNQHQKM
ncbi:putative transformer-2 protein-like alpha-like isoform X2 [Apostichopus japonicus]|uniref:Putative transformer-2 protein-like alpha-like isoform X2 n=1 Tax=Stichopus japonicus TaxID=307972 RepID=A0A2G8LPR0_STIJA|nr:putative transformer-2 protein-like alpha-like isoform X2 [Apostichopus japonicus]